jgi:uncharacterized protein
MHKRQFISLLGALPAWALAGSAAAPSSNYKVGDKLTPAAPVLVNGIRQLKWDDLIPKNWDPYAAYKGLDLSKMRDGDPRTREAMDKVRESWNNAPVVNDLNGSTVRIPGFMIPMDTNKDEVLAFLLVPYFGACIHTPPPPANQIIDVKATPPVRGSRMMDTVWVTGKLSTVRSDSPFGTVGYRLAAQHVEPYVKEAERK